MAIACVCAQLARGADVASAPAPYGITSWQSLYWQRVASSTSGEGVSALAVEPGTGRLAIGDARGALIGANGEGFRRVLARGPVNDLAFLSEGVLLAATDAGLFRVEDEGRVEALALGLGESARAAHRLAVAAGVVAAATAGGAFLSRDGRQWESLAGSLPSGAASAIALREAQGREGLECWVAIQGALWRVRLGSEGATLAEASRRELIPFAVSDDGPVDLVFDLPQADFVAVFPTVLAVRRARDAAWEILRPQLPPGARAVRLRAELGRLWLATDRGLLEAPALAGPWRRASPPAGTGAVRDVSQAGGTLYAATASGLLASRSEPVGFGSPAKLRASLLEEPAIGVVHRAALAYLDLGSGQIAALRRGVARRGWLPVVGLRLASERDTSYGRDTDEAFVSGDTRRLFDDDWSESDEFEVALTLSWDLGDVAYHPEAIDVSREAREILKLRDDVLDEITQLYFERQRVLAELAGRSDWSSAEAARLRLRADELAAGIDGWTGGWFSRNAAPLAP